jgi:hypothetical protein
MFNLELTEREARDLKHGINLVLRTAREDGYDLPKAARHFANTFSGVGDALVSLGLFLALGYDGTPAGGSFLSNWSKFREKYLTIIEAAPVVDPVLGPFYPEIEHGITENQFGKYPYGKVFDIFFVFTRPNSPGRPPQSGLQISPNQSPLLSIDPLITEGSAEFWELINEVKACEKRYYAADIKWAKHYSFEGTKPI